MCAGEVHGEMPIRGEWIVAYCGVAGGKSQRASDLVQARA